MTKKIWRTAVKKPIVIEFREPLAEVEEIRTREGTVKAKQGEDFVIRGVEGELYPIKKKIFYKTYKITKTPVINKEKILLEIINDIFGMAVRYAHGKHTYAPSTVRNCYKRLKVLYPDFKLQKDPTITPPSPEELQSWAASRQDYLDDLFQEGSHD